jgi:integrase
MPETVALYIADRASTLASGTITRRLTSITKAHQAAGFTSSPATTRHFVVGETLKGIRRTIGTAQHGKAPLVSADIRRIIAARRKDLLGLRDAALVLVGFAGGSRRSELAGIHISDLKFSADGVVVTVRKSKTDQGAPEGRWVCPSVLVRIRVRSALSGSGLPLPESLTVPSSVRSADTDMYRGAACTKIP